jgi:hypothetical protein
MPNELEANFKEKERRMRKNSSRWIVIFISVVFMVQLCGCTAVNKDFFSGDISKETHSVLITKGGVRLVELDGKERETSMGNLMQEKMEIFPIEPGRHRLGLIFANQSYDSKGTAYLNHVFESGKYYSIKGIFGYKRLTINYEITEETDTETINEANTLLK